MNDISIISVTTPLIAESVCVLREWCFQHNITNSFVKIYNINEIYNEDYDFTSELTSIIENTDKSLIIVDLPKFSLFESFIISYNKRNLSMENYRILSIQRIFPSLYKSLNLSGHYTIQSYSFNDPNKENQKFISDFQNHVQSDAIVSSFFFYVYNYIYFRTTFVKIINEHISIYKTSNSQFLVNTLLQNEFITPIGKIMFKNDFTVVTPSYLCQYNKTNLYNIIFKNEALYVQIHPFLDKCTVELCFSESKNVIPIGLLYSLHGKYAELDNIYFKGHLTAINDYNEKVYINIIRMKHILLDIVLLI